MSVSYHVGDKVRILSWDELEEKFRTDEDGDICADSGEYAEIFLKRMSKYCNCTATVIAVCTNVGVALDIPTPVGSYWWVSESFVQLLPPDPKDLSLNFEDIFR